jgi:hypothetical protein
MNISQEMIGFALTWQKGHPGDLGEGNLALGPVCGGPLQQNPGRLSGVLLCRFPRPDGEKDKAIGLAIGSVLALLRRQDHGRTESDGQRGAKADISCK